MHYLSRGQATTAIYFAIFTLAMHYAVTLYINSSFLKEFVGESRVGLVYTALSLVSICALALIAPAFRRFGHYRVTSLMMFFSVVALFLLAQTSSVIEILPLFILIHSISILTKYSLDLYLEEFSDDAETGWLRGVALTIMNVAVAIAPTLAALLIVNETDFSLVFIASAIFMMFTLAITTHKLSHIEPRVYLETAIGESLLMAWRDKNIWAALMTQFLLQVFYSIIVIYAPIFLRFHIGFSWLEVGMMTSIALISFIILQLPLGWLADKFYGEKEFLVGSFVTLAGTSVLMAYLGSASFAIWAALLFCGRIGAATLEVMSETYFFKQVRDGDAGVISLFRNAQPVAYVITPLLASGFLAFFDFRFIFLALGVVMLSGLYWCARLTDTK